MTFYLKRDVVKNQYKIVSEWGTLISGPRRFEVINQAEDWIRSFASSWPGSKIVIDV